MSYRTQAILAKDADLLERVAACAATQGIVNPVTWAYENQWKLSAEPGWDTAYSAAVNSMYKHPGNSEDIITDAMILTAVNRIKLKPTLSRSENKTAEEKA